jgi:hypothetical protein
MGNFAIGARRRGIFLGVGVFLAAMLLVAAAFRVAHNERAFELHRWETRLRADSVQPLGMVNGWLKSSHDALRAVAVNPTVQISLSQAALGGTQPEGPESEAQSAFLASYIASLSGRGAFASAPAAMGAPLQSDTGLAVLDAHRHVVASTFGYRPSPQLVARLIATMRDGRAGPLASAANDGARNGFLAIVRPIQGDASALPVGYVVGERKLDAAFWMSDGSVLAADRGHESLIALGPTTRLVGSSLGKPGRAEGSGEFLAARTPLRLQRANDLEGMDALHVGVPVTGANWVLVESVPASSALAGVEARIRNLLTILLLSLLAIILGILALWRHMAGVQQAAAREASVKLYRGVAEVLLQAIDQRDPGAAEHSRRVAALSRQIALRMGSSQADADAAELAGALMNVGKLFVPVELLTKTGALDTAEASRFADGSARWLELLARTPFDPPLEPVLRDAYRLGRGEAADAPSRNAHIIAAANAAVALMSPRAYRMAHAPQETLDILAGLSPPVPQPILAAMAGILASRE